MMKIFFSIFLLLYLSGVFAQTEFGNKQFQIIRSQNPPTIDGQFSIDEWRDATLVQQMVERTPVVGATPTFPTKIYVKYDSQNIYIAALLYQPKETTVANQLVQGQSTWQDDYFGVGIDPTNNKTDGYYFHVSPNSITEDGLVENREYIDNWRGIWNARSSINEDYWVAEIAIPVQTLAFDENIDTWGIQFRRKISEPSHQYFWNLNDTQGWGWYANQSGNVKGISGLDTGMGLELKPSVSIKDQSFTNENDDLKRFQPSLDLFYKLTPSLTAALTFNTDFSGTDVDQQEVNLGRFSLFLPEKRDFFLQDAGIFEFGGLNTNGRPFFSRQIGLASTGQPLDIDAGIKLTGKIGQFNIGMLSVQQNAENSFDGTTSVSVARGRYSFNETGYIGAILTSGNPTLDQQDLLFGVDARQGLTLSNGLLIEGNAWWQTVDNKNALAKDNSAYGFNLVLPNDEYWAKLDYMVIEENFNPSLGFVNRNNIKQLSSVIEYRNRINNNLLKTIQSSFGYNYVTDIDGMKLSEKIRWNPIELSFKSNAYTHLTYYDRFERVQSSFSLAGEVDILPGDYSFTRYGFVLESNPSKPYSAFARFETGGFFSGSRDDYEINITLKPIKYVYFGLNYGINKMNFDGYRFDTKTTRLNVNFAFNAFWSWTNNIQYDNVSDTAGIFSRLKYEPRAGEIYQLALSRSLLAEDETTRFATQSQEIALKGVYTLRF